MHKSTVFLAFIVSLVLVSPSTSDDVNPTVQSDANPAVQSDTKPSTAIKSDVVANYRLPRDLIPMHYDLTIFTDVKEPEFKFDGIVTIHLICIQKTRDLVLHMNNLTLAHDSITRLVKQGIANPSEELIPVQPVSHKYDAENEIYSATFETPFITNQEYTVEIAFNGVLNEGLSGFYRSSYTNRATNDTEWLATTQFESIDARRAFPCFDEPAMKSTFTISMGHPKHLTSISNMPLERSMDIPSKPDWVLNVFQKSVPMSTYLVAFIISNFTYRESKPSKDFNDVKFRTWARKEVIDQVDFAAESGPEFLNFFERYFNIRYPLPKQDMVAIPDFSAGAMENWGLITYRESSLLYDNVRSSIHNEYSIANTVAHELAHQWFGNLVTMKWWTDLWLNEGFATYMAAQALDDKYNKPGSKHSWKLLDGEALSNILLIFPLDSLSSSHPVSVPIGNPSEISQIFDAISYRKGSFLIRMMNKFLSPKVFQQGVSKYLDKYSYGNAEQDDLWASLTEAGHRAKILPKDLTVKRIMDSWTLQTGYPVVDVVREYGTKKNTIKFNQKRFLALPDLKRSDSSQCWWIPLTFTSSNDKLTSSKPIWLPCDQQKSELSVHDQHDIVVNDQMDLNAGLEDNDWLIINRDMNALIRVNYDDKNWDMIINQLISNHTKIPTLNRVQVIMDVMEFSKLNILKYSKAFDLMSYIHKETEYLPWRSALNTLYSMDNLLKRTGPTYEYFQAYVRNLLATQFSTQPEIRSSLEGYEERLHKTQLYSAACHFNLPECVDRVQAEYKAWKQSKSLDSYVIPADMMYLTYCGQIKTASLDEWSFLYKRYLTIDTPSEKINILRALGCSKDPSILNHFLSLAFDSPDRQVRTQDLATVFASIAHNPEGYEVAKKYLYTNVDKIYDLYGPKNQQIVKYLSQISSQIVNEDELREFNEIKEKHYEKYLKQSQILLQQAEETPQINLQWHRHNFELVSQLLDERQYQVPKAD
uniref:Aminopeptidase n=1 Tax=Cacopsylla melanoneura TaxID=428564 RepID=A0A8D8UND7_9HEMI